MGKYQLVVPAVLPSRCGVKHVARSKTTHHLHPHWPAPDTLHDNKQVLLSTTSSPHHTDHLALSGPNSWNAFVGMWLGLQKGLKAELHLVLKCVDVFLEYQVTA